ARRAAQSASRAPSGGVRLIPPSSVAHGSGHVHERKSCYTAASSADASVRRVSPSAATARHRGAEQVQRDATMQASQQRLRSVPGVGTRVALPLLVAGERYRALAGERGTAKGIVADVGLDPQPYESGTSVLRHARISRQGGRLLRARLYMGAL